MKLNAKIIKLELSIEEEVLVEIDGLLITCFICLCPYKLDEGKIYPVKLSFVFLDDVIFRETDAHKYEVRKIDNHGFRYKLTGKVENGALNIGHGVEIEDEAFREYSYLEGRFIELVVDRISIDFL